MKKLVVLALVLAVASLANAAYTLTVSGAGNNVLSIGTTADIVAAGGSEMYYALLVPTGALDVSAASIVPSGTGFAIDTNAGAGDVITTGALSGIWGGIFTTGGAIPAGALINGITYTGGQTTAELHVIDVSPTDQSWSLGNTIASAQVGVPEPITMVLLGLGGLFLRKK